MPKKVKGIKLTCNICGEDHGEFVELDRLLEWVKKSATPIFMCPKCGEDGLSHINNVHLKVLAKYLDILNSIYEAISLEQQKLARHGVWVDIVTEE